MKFALFVFVLLFASPVAALELYQRPLVLQGELTQGGLVVGQTDQAGATVRVDGRKIIVSAKGYFLIGFGRDAAAVSHFEITYANGKTQSRILQVAKRQYKTQHIKGLPSRQVTPDKQAQKRIKSDNALISAVRHNITPHAYFVSGFVWPVKGPVSGVYGSQRILNGKPRSPHNGVDIAASRGTPIVSAGDGIVALVHQDMFYTGKTMMIDHGLGLTSVYAHMKKILVKEGQYVIKGQLIGEVGASGRATGPHLHWGVTLLDVHLDPALIRPAVMYP